MWSTIKIIGRFLILTLLVAHLLTVGLFMTPCTTLLEAAVANEAGFFNETDMPEKVQAFIATHHVQVAGDYALADDSFGKVALYILRVRKNHFMDSDQQLTLDLNLLNYGEGVVGLKEAALFYYKKPLNELSDSEWITLINLQKIFSKK